MRTLKDYIYELAEDLLQDQKSLDELWQDTTSKMLNLPESDELIQVAKKELNVPEEYDVADWTITERWDDIEEMVTKVWEDYGCDNDPNHMDDYKLDEYYRHYHDGEYEE